MLFFEDKNLIAGKIPDQRHARGGGFCQERPSAGIDPKLGRDIIRNHDHEDGVDEQAYSRNHDEQQKFLVGFLRWQVFADPKPKPENHFTDQQQKQQEQVKNRLILLVSSKADDDDRSGAERAQDRKLHQVSQQI